MSTMDINVICGLITPRNVIVSTPGKTWFVDYFMFIVYFNVQQCGLRGVWEVVYNSVMILTTAVDYWKIFRMGCYCK